MEEFGDAFCDRFVLSVGKEKITSNILLTVEGELIEITIIPEGEEENSGRDNAEKKDTTVISALMKSHSPPLSATESKHTCDIYTASTTRSIIL